MDGNILQVSVSEEFVKKLPFGFEAYYMYNNVAKNLLKKCCNLAWDKFG